MSNLQKNLVHVLSACLWLGHGFVKLFPVLAWGHMQG